MKLLEKILLATDFDRAANDALQTALYVAKGFNSEIILLHVIPEPKPDSISMDAVKDAVKTQLRRLKEEIVEKGVQIKEMVVESGSPFDRIITQADRKDANVIIMGDGNKTPTDKFPLGITAGKVMRKANKPVWVVKHGFTAPIKKYCVLWIFPGRPNTPLIMPFTWHVISKSNLLFCMLLPRYRLHFSLQA